MSTTTKYISLDFYNNSIVNVYAKQADANSRFINATCTDHGKKVFMNKSIVSAFVKMKKSDGNYIYNDTEILDDGTILISLTQQMLAVSGKQIVDLMILSMPDITLKEIESMDSIEDLSNVSVISIMPFYLIVTESSIDNSEIESTDEFDALVQATARLKKLETSVRIAEEKRQDDITGEAYRIANEKARQKSEIQRENTNAEAIIAIENAEIATSTAIIATNNANTATNNAIEATDNAIIATNDANKAVEDVNNVIAEFETIKDQSGIIMQDEKGSENGIATLDENGKVPNTQLNIANNLTTTTTGLLLDASQGNVIRLELEQLNAYITKTIEELPKIHFSNTVDNSIGKNGDILMVPIS